MTGCLKGRAGLETTHNFLIWNEQLGIYTEKFILQTCPVLRETQSFEQK
jgi:hypothetical protein